MDLKLSGRTAAVAAGTAGLGFATARALADAGVAVVVCGRDQHRVDEAVTRLGERASGFVCDVASAAGARAFVELATDRLGHLDILVANGGGPPPGTFGSTPESDYQGALEKNLLSVVAMCLAAVPAMRERRWGRVLAITSSAVRQPNPTLILSNTARSGLTAFLKTLSREVAPDGVTVNTIQPGIHATGRITQLYGSIPDAATLGIPAGFVGDPADFGEIAAFMCSEQARFMTGVNLQVDGGAYPGLI